VKNPNLYPHASLPGQYPGPTETDEERRRGQSFRYQRLTAK
jgi:hypothetical protein